MRFLVPVLGLLILALSAPSLTAQDAAPCEIFGHLSIEEVHVVRARRGIDLLTIDDRDVRVTPMGGGQFRVRTADEGVAIEGRTESPVPLVLALDHTFGGVASVAAGTRVEGITPHGASLRVDVPLHEGVALQHVAVGCPDLAARTPTDAALDTTLVARGPTWHTRTARLRLRAAPGDESAPVNLTFGASARASVAWTERERRAGWVRLEATLAHAHVLGWARDSDLAR